MPNERPGLGSTLQIHNRLRRRQAVPMIDKFPRAWSQVRIGGPEPFPHAYSVPTRKLTFAGCHILGPFAQAAGECLRALVAAQLLRQHQVVQQSCPAVYQAEKPGVMSAMPGLRREPRRRPDAPRGTPTPASRQHRHCSEDKPGRYWGADGRCVPAGSAFPRR